MLFSNVEYFAWVNNILCYQCKFLGSTLKRLGLLSSSLNNWNSLIEEIYYLTHLPAVQGWVTHLYQIQPSFCLFVDFSGCLSLFVQPSTYPSNLMALESKERELIRTFRFCGQIALPHCFLHVLQACAGSPWRCGSGDLSSLSIPYTLWQCSERQIFVSCNHFRAWNAEYLPVQHWSKYLPHPFPKTSNKGYLKSLFAMSRLERRSFSSIPLVNDVPVMFSEVSKNYHLSQSLLFGSILIVNLKEIRYPAAPVSRCSQ